MDWLPKAVGPGSLASQGIAACRSRWKGVIPTKIVCLWTTCILAGIPPSLPVRPDRRDVAGGIRSSAGAGCGQRRTAVETRARARAPADHRHDPVRADLRLRMAPGAARSGPVARRLPVVSVLERVGGCGTTSTTRSAMRCAKPRAVTRRRARRCWTPSRPSPPAAVSRSDTTRARKYEVASGISWSTRAGCCWSAWCTPPRCSSTTVLVVAPPDAPTARAMAAADLLSGSSESVERVGRLDEESGHRDHAVSTDRSRRMYGHRSRRRARFAQNGHQRTLSTAHHHSEPTDAVL